MMKKWAVYGLQFGRMMLVEDGFQSAKKAVDYIKEKLAAVETEIKSYRAGATSEIRQ